MKKIHFVGLAVIVIAIVLLFSASKDMSSYASFDDAAKNQSVVRVVGTLSKDKEMYYDPAKDPNYFSFYIKDRNGEERKVILLDSKPQDFELSEQIVVTGKMDGQDFVANDILLKCPSKYKDEEIKLRES